VDVVNLAHGGLQWLSSPPPPSLQRLFLLPEAAGEAVRRWVAAGGAPAAGLLVLAAWRRGGLTGGTSRGAGSVRHRPKEGNPLGGRALALRHCITALLCGSVSLCKCVTV